MIVALQVRVLFTPHEGLREGPVWEGESLLASERALALALVLGQDLVMVKG